MIGEVIQQGRVSPEKKNVGFLVEKLDESAAGRLVAALSYELAGEFNTFIIVCNRRESGKPASGTVLDLNGGMAMVGLKLTKSSAQINRMIKEYDIELLVSAGQRGNVINGLYNHSCTSAACVFTGAKGAGASSGVVSGTAARFRKRMLSDALKEADYMIRLNSAAAGGTLQTNLEICADSIRDLIDR